MGIKNALSGFESALRPLRLKPDDLVYDIGCDATRLLFVAALAGAKSLERDMDQIRRSLKADPREIRMMYIHPEPSHREYFAHCDWLEKTGEKTFPGAWGIPAFYFKFGPDAALDDPS